MSTAKTEVSHKLIKAFLKKNYGVVSFQTIADGEISQAFLFSTVRGEKVLRVNSQAAEGFEKDKYASEHFSNKLVRIPVIEEIGELEDGLYYSVSERAQGKTLDKFGKHEIDRLLPEIFAVLNAIHNTTATGKGYGWWHADGNGKFDSWQRSLIEMQTSDDDIKLADIEFFERDIHDETSNIIAELYKYCPEDRQLVHGDYGFNNVLSDGHELTGVIDWHGSMYGDPVFDIAWLDFWAAQQGFADAFTDFRSKNNLHALENFDERLKCYKLIIGINSMCFFAKSEQQEKYELTKKILAAI